MAELLKKHPNYNDWKFKNPVAFHIKRSPRNKAIQVHAKFQGLKKWRIVSWVSCAKGKVTRKPDIKNQLTQAMRYSIRIQIKNWKDQNSHYLQQKCFICDDKNHLEVDHFPNTFSDMRDSFLEANPHIIEVILRWNNKRTTYMFPKKNAFNTQWQRFHKKHASYRWLCSDCNKKMNQK